MLKILIAEDHPINRMQLCKLVQGLTWQATFVEDGKHAIAKVRHGGFDLVLMDCFMPECDGFTAAREIRSFEEKVGRDPIPIIAISASADNMAYALAVGMDGFLPKPIERNGLLKAVNSIPALHKHIA